MEHIRIKECRTINKEEAGVVGAVVLETLVSIKEEEATSMSVDDILVEALVRETLVKTEVEEEGVTGAVEVDSK
jgi:methionine aminopeptidase